MHAKEGNRHPYLNWRGSCSTATTFVHWTIKNFVSVKFIRKIKQTLWRHETHSEWHRWRVGENWVVTCEFRFKKEKEKKRNKNCDCNNLNKQSQNNKVSIESARALVTKQNGTKLGRIKTEVLTKLWLSFTAFESEDLRNKRRFGDHDPRRSGDFFSVHSTGVAEPRRASLKFGDRGKLTFEDDMDATPAWATVGGMEFLRLNLYATTAKQFTNKYGILTNSWAELWINPPL